MYKQNILVAIKIMLLNFICLFVSYFRLHLAKQTHEALDEKLKQVSESALSAEERASRMDELLKQEEVHQKELDTELKKLRDLHFRKTQELYQARTEERNTEAEIQVTVAGHRTRSSDRHRHEPLKHAR